MRTINPCWKEPGNPLSTRDSDHFYNRHLAILAPSQHPTNALPPSFLSCCTCFPGLFSRPAPAKHTEDHQAQASCHSGAEVPNVTTREEVLQVSRGGSQRCCGPSQVQACPAPPAKYLVPRWRKQTAIVSIL